MDLQINFIGRRRRITQSMCGVLTFTTAIRVLILRALHISFVLYGLFNNLTAKRSIFFNYMALYYELQVFKDVYTLVQKVFLYTQEFPREYKYTLGQDMKRDSIQLVRSIYRANKAKDKVVYLETFLDDFELLKFELRLCVDMKILAIKKQAELSGLMDSIGKQITGWRNANR